MEGENYYFYEWLIIGKRVNEEEFKKLSAKELYELKQEYLKFKEGLK